jgi:hypothetical protein
LTACFNLMKALQHHTGPSDVHCTSCVYFSKNLDGNAYAALLELADHCGLGFAPHDADCREMRTNNCSARTR